MKETFRSEYVHCGKAGCRTCPHGPYWYAYWRDESGKLKKRYVGKRLPEPEPDRQAEYSGNRLDDILRHNLASADLAWEILGLARGTDSQAVKRRFRELAMRHHPDRKGDPQEFKRVSAAYAYLVNLYEWR